MFTNCWKSDKLERFGFSKFWGEIATDFYYYFAISKTAYWTSYSKIDSLFQRSFSRKFSKFPKKVSLEKSKIVQLFVFFGHLEILIEHQTAIVFQKVYFILGLQLNIFILLKNEFFEISIKRRVRKRFSTHLALSEVLFYIKNNKRFFQKACCVA